MKNPKKYMIGIPSLSRPTQLKKKTLRVLGDTPNVFVFVEPQEYSIYRALLPEVSLIVLPEPGKGLTYCTNYMGKYAKEKGYDYLFKIDDDVSKFEGVNGELNKDAVSLFLSDAIDTMDKYKEVGGISFYAIRFWYFEKRKGLKYSNKGFHLWGIRFVRVSDIPEMYPTIGFEDTLQSLHLWEKGKETLRYAKVGVQVEQNTGKGGMEKYRKQHFREMALNYIINRFKGTGIKSRKDGQPDLDLGSWQKTVKLDSNHKYNQ